MELTFDNIVQYHVLSDASNSANGMLSLMAKLKIQDDVMENRLQLIINEFKDHHRAMVAQFKSMIPDDFLRRFPVIFFYPSLGEARLKRRITIVLSDKGLVEDFIRFPLAYQIDDQELLWFDNGAITPEMREELNTFAKQLIIDDEDED